MRIFVMCWFILMSVSCSSPPGDLCRASDCRANESCNSEGVCAPAKPQGKCSRDEECSGGQTCQNARCVEKKQVGCSSDSTCGLGETCQEGKCRSTSQPGCQSPVDCGANERCERGQCVPKSGGCTTSGDCSSGEKCLGGKCVKTSSEDCPIPKKKLRKPLPYSSESPATVVKAGTSCANGSGYKSVQILNILTYGFGSVRVKQPARGVAFYQISIPLKQKKPTSSELSRLASRLGISSSALKGAQFHVIRSASTSVQVGSPALPSSIKAAFFLPTSVQKEGYLTFSSKSKADVDSVYTLLGRGVTLTLSIGQLSGSGTYRYTVEVRRSGTKLKVKQIM